MQTEEEEETRGEGLRLYVGGRHGVKVESPRSVHPSKEIKAFFYLRFAAVMRAPLQALLLRREPGTVGEGEGRERDSIVNKVD